MKKINNTILNIEMLKNHPDESSELEIFSVEITEEEIEEHEKMTELVKAVIIELVSGTYYYHSFDFTIRIMYSNFIIQYTAYNISRYATMEEIKLEKKLWEL